MKPYAEWKMIALRYPCTGCGAPPGKPCITSNGRRSNDIHIDRSRLASANRWKDPDEQPHPQDRR